MKITYTFIFFYYISKIIFSQTLYLEENFNYDTGDLNGQGNWNLTAIGATEILNVIDGSLCNDPYPSSCEFNSVQIISGGNRQDCMKEFTSTSITSGTLYLSFLIQVNSCGIDGDNDGYFLCFMPSGVGNVCRVSVDYVSSDEIKFGIQRNSGTGGTRTLTPSYVYSAGTYIFLIVMKYDFNTGIASLFVNPSLSGNEPSDADATNDTGTSITEIMRIQLRQGGDPADCDVVIDGIRISDSWSQAPLPVELDSFTATTKNNVVNLNWVTKTEVNNYGFEVERASSTNMTIQGWEKIGFVTGAGNSNSPKLYNYVDNIETAGKYYYRLKQIDTDGGFEYSNVIEVNIIPEEFCLYQNYPNPFNPTTKIKYTIPKASLVTLKLYGVLSNEIETLVNEEKQAGTYKLTWNAANLPSGIYFYQIQAGSFIDTKKMILLK